MPGVRHDEQGTADCGGAADRLAVTELIHRYAYNIRHGIPAECADLFAPDAEYQIGTASPLNPNTFVESRLIVGRSAIVEFLLATRRADMRIVPTISNVLVDLDGDQATSTCLMSNRVYPAGEGVSGEYRDIFVRAGRWRFSRRTFVKFQ